MRKYKFQYVGGPFPEAAPEVEEDAVLFDKVLDEMRGLFRERNNVYRSRFRKEGVPGMLRQVGHKMHRLSSLFCDGESVKADEDVTENFLDLAVYGALGAMLSHFGDSATRECRHLLTCAPHPDVKGPNGIQVTCILCGWNGRLSE